MFNHVPILIGPSPTVMIGPCPLVMRADPTGLCGLIHHPRTKGKSRLLILDGHESHHSI
jgi:hypothetical protein